MSLRPGVCRRRRQALGTLLSVCWIFLATANSGSRAAERWKPGLFPTPQPLSAPSSTNASAGFHSNARSNASAGTNASIVSPAAIGSEKPDDQQRLAPGDRVTFRVIEEKIEPKSLLVADSGEIEVPYIGRIMAKQRTCQELVSEIKPKLEEKYFHRATVILSVELLNQVRGSIYLFGEIRAPGAQPMPSGESLTLAKAIIRSGGFTDFADKRHVKVTREAALPAGTTNQTFTVNVGRVLQRGQLQQDLKLEPGDIIYVPTRLVNF